MDRYQEVIEVQEQQRTEASANRLMGPPSRSGDKVAPLVVYLATSSAAFITGASLTIDGRFAA